MEKWKSILLASLTLLFLASCGTELIDDTDTVDDPVENMEETVDDIEEEVDELTEEEENIGQSFTLDELSEYDGKDGNPAYVAIDGVVYDLTDVDSWNEGEHAESLVAGNDYTSEIMEAEHGDSVLSDLPIVGTLVEE